jgi:UDP-2,4-diacetamido-2,4,6-trideoxy-beta-L-altropyranose hydrolase
MNLLIRADSGSSIGLGHIKRDLVLAVQYGGGVVFACRELPGNAIHLIEAAGYTVHVLLSDAPEELIALIDSLKPDRLVIDHYGIGPDQEQQIKEATGVELMVLDDTYEAHECDILLNHNIGADAKRYTGLVPTECELRCGSRYGLIAPEFTELRREPIEDTVLVCMGGSDPAGLNMKVAALLECFGYDCVIATTTANSDLERLRRDVAKHPNTKLVVDTPSMAGLMRTAAFAVVTPSVLAQEAMAAGVPIIAVQTADNQTQITKALKRMRIPVLERWKPRKFELALKELHEVRRFNIA